MSTPLPTYLNCSQEVVGGLIETVTAALLNSFPVIDADPEDIEMTLDALKVLRPKVVELETFAALLQMQRGHWDEAIHIFSRLVANVPQFAYAKALLAFCLSFKGDPNWRQSAAEAIRENPDRETRQLVRALAARDDLQDALRAHKNPSSRRNSQSMRSSLTIDSINSTAAAKLSATCVAASAPYDCSMCQ